VSESDDPAHEGTGVRVGFDDAVDSCHDGFVPLAAIGGFLNSAALLEYLECAASGGKGAEA
jgi:hypothetical protein